MEKSLNLSKMGGGGEAGSEKQAKELVDSNCWIALKVKRNCYLKMTSAENWSEQDSPEHQG